MNQDMSPTMEEVKKNFQIQLESFEGPLDLLLALIQKNEMDIFNISIARITEDYLEYMKIVQTLDLDVAGDYLVIAATLVLMKSRALLPTETPEQEEEEEEDPELLMRRIEEYKQYQSAAEVLREKEQVQKQQFYRESKSSEDLGETIEFYDLNIYDLFSNCSVIIEAFDLAETKKMLIETVLTQLPETHIISGSGMAGWGKTNEIRQRKIEKLYLCGDEKSEISDENPPLAPRVGIVANMQANICLEILLEMKE